MMMMLLLLLMMMMSTVWCIFIIMTTYVELPFVVIEIGVECRCAHLTTDQPTTKMIMTRRASFCRNVFIISLVFLNSFADDEQALPLSLSSFKAN